MRAVGYKVLVKLDSIDKNKKEETSEYGVILSVKTNSELEREQQGMTKGEIVSIGQVACHTKYNSECWFNIGDKVKFYRHAGTLLEDDLFNDDCEYRMITDLDVEGVYE